MKLADLRYAEVKSIMNDLPQTWYPALLGEMVKAGYQKKVFITGGASKLVQQLEKLLVCPNCSKMDMQLEVIRELKPDCLRSFLHCNYCGCERPIEIQKP